ncbi:MAG: DoxX family protein [Chloroflexota bacterium]
MIYLLWILQVLLALLFLFAGVVKLMMPAETLTEQTPLPIALIYLVAIAEVVGALGLILPGLFRVYPALTPLAAAGLAIIMLGAVISTAATMDPSMAIMPLVIGLLVAFTAFGRWRLAPLSSRLPSHPA